MKKLLLAFTMVTLSTHAQVGIGTTNPHDSSILDIESTTKGLLPPRMTEVQMNAITAPAEGLIVYCLDCAPVGLNVFDGANWNTIGAASVSADCDINGFTGTYISGEALSDAKFSVTITNNSFSTTGISFATSDLVLSGVAGVTVASVTPASVALNAGESQLVEYTLSGMPSTTGTLTGTWTKLALNCIKTRNIGNGDATFINGTNNAYVFSVNDLAVPLNSQGTLAIGSTVNVAYRNGVGAYDAYTSTDIAIPAAFCEDGASDWTLGYSYNAGTFSSLGNIVVTLITKKAGVITAWDAKRVDDVTTINFNCVAVPWSVNGNTYINTVGIDEGGDAIRASLSISGVAYDLAIVNNLVEITQAEYENILNIVPSSILGGNVSSFSAIVAFGSGSFYANTNSNTTDTDPIAANSYVAAVKIAPNYYVSAIGTVSLGVAPIAAPGYVHTCITGASPSLTYSAYQIRYFAVKRPTTHIGTNQAIGPVLTGNLNMCYEVLTSGYMGAYNGGSTSCGDTLITAFASNWNPAIQYTVTTQKSW